MNILEEFSEIADSDELNKFKETNPESILTSVFLNKEKWEFNYLFKNKMITFFEHDNIIKT